MPKQYYNVIHHLLYVKQVVSSVKLSKFGDAYERRQVYQLKYTLFAVTAEALTHRQKCSTDSSDEF